MYGAKPFSFASDGCYRTATGSQAKAPAPLDRKSLCVSVGQALSPANSELVSIFCIPSERLTSVF